MDYLVEYLWTALWVSFWLVTALACLALGWLAGTRHETTPSCPKDESPSTKTPTTVDEPGQAVDPHSVVRLPMTHGLPKFPRFEPKTDDAFLNALDASGDKWVILADQTGAPKLVLDADDFLRTVVFQRTLVNPYDFCHRPVIVANLEDLASACDHLAGPHRSHTGIIENDMLLVWNTQPRLVTRADLLDCRAQSLPVNVTRNTVAQSCH